MEHQRNAIIDSFKVNMGLVESHRDSGDPLDLLATRPYVQSLLDQVAQHSQSGSPYGGE